MSAPARLATPARGLPPRTVARPKVLVVSEYYPRDFDEVLGVWVHRQCLAARDAGAEVRVLVLHRPLPSLAALRARDRRAIAAPLRQAARANVDGLRIDYMRYLSPPRPLSYASWGAWAAPFVARALTRIRAEFRFDLIHAHYAVPAGDAVRRAAPTVPLVVSVHGGDVHGRHSEATSVSATLAHANLVLANSQGTKRRCEQRGGREVRIVHLGADVPEQAVEAGEHPALISIGHLVARKRHADVIAAMALLREAHPDLRYVIVGDGPERERLAELARTYGLQGRVEFAGQLPHHRAMASLSKASLFVLPSVQEAFGVAYTEAMAAGVPAIGSAGEDGPTEIAAAGAGIELVTPRDPRALAAVIAALLNDEARRRQLGKAARSTVREHFSWSRCGEETVSAYRQVIATSVSGDEAVVAAEGSR